MESTVKLRYIRQSASKIRFVLKQVNGMRVNNALDKLTYSNKKAGNFISKAINSAVANLLSENENVDKEKLFIVNSFVDQGSTMKRFRPRAMGRAMPIRKRSSHLTITVSDNNKLRS